MIQTAAELRYSETAFIKQTREASFKTRYFTPVQEVELCGHATIGSFHALMELGLIMPGNTYINETLAGSLEIYVKPDTILMEMAKPCLGDSITEDKPLKRLYNVMGLSHINQGMYKDTVIRLLPRLVSTGLMDIMLPVNSLDELNKISPDFNALSDLSKEYNVVGVHAFTCNTKDSSIHARNFAPSYGIDEEAATGTSNGALAFYLYNLGIIEENTVYTVIQGEKMKRPSGIDTQIVSTDTDNVTRVNVGGSAVTLVKGEINL